MKKQQFLFLLLIIISKIIIAQTFEDFKKQKEAEMDAFRQKQEKFIRQMQNDFDEYVRQQDQAFAEYLSTEWEAFEIEKGQSPPSIPKPPEKPKYIEEKKVEDNGSKKKKGDKGSVIQLKNPLMVIEDGKARPVISPTINKSSAKKEANESLEVLYYGNNLNFNFNEEVIVDPPLKIDEQELGQYWLDISNTDIIPVINQLRDYKDELNLNDWAYFSLVSELGNLFYPESETGAVLMTWFLMNRTGYKARVGFTNETVSILLPSRNTLYSRKYLTVDGMNYYLINSQLQNDNIFTYSMDYPGAVKFIDFNIYQPLSFAPEIETRTFRVNYQQDDIEFVIDYNKNVIDFYRNYPQVDMDVYFNASVSNASKESILAQFKEKISGMSDQKALSFLLHFVQTAFRYQVDDEQFGKEKFLFAEETLFYPASDCEDRSVLFAFLVKELMGKKVIGLEYPNHVSTAVNFSQATEGEHVIFREEPYMIADATYENAPLGLSMPEYRNAKPIVIPLSNTSFENRLKTAYWELANRSGGFRGDRLDDIVFDRGNNVFMTGYYDGKATFGEYTLESGNDNKSRAAFIVKYNDDRIVQWAKRINSSKSATGYAIHMDSQNAIYISGSFRGTIDAGTGLSPITCKEGSSDVFLAKFSTDGKLLWIKKAGLDTYPQDNYFTYDVKFSKEGALMGTSLFSENEYADHRGIAIDKDGLVHLNGSFRNTTGFGMDMLTYTPAEGGDMDVAESLKTENDRLVENNCERSIAGVFSVLNHAKLAGFKMSGKEAQEALDRYNPGFKEEHDDIYKSLGKINFVFNDDGIVSVETSDGKTVQIREMKIKDQSRMKIVPFEDGDIRIDIFNGVQVGKLFIWFNLNYVKMFQENGNLLFDYDSRHSQLTMNMKKHILR